MSYKKFYEHKENILSLLIRAESDDWKLLISKDKNIIHPSYSLHIKNSFFQFSESLYNYSFARDKYVKNFFNRKTIFMKAMGTFFRLALIHGAFLLYNFCGPYLINDFSYS